jgi:hypothetical protein
MPDGEPIKDFPFLLAGKWTQNRFEKLDGLIGLSKSYYSTKGENSAPTFLDSLY